MITTRRKRASRCSSSRRSGSSASPARRCAGGNVRHLRGCRPPLRCAGKSLLRRRRRPTHGVVRGGALLFTRRERAAEEGRGAARAAGGGARRRRARAPRHGDPCGSVERWRGRLRGRPCRCDGTGRHTAVASVRRKCTAGRLPDGASRCRTTTGLLSPPPRPPSPPPHHVCAVFARR